MAAERPRKRISMRALKAISIMAGIAFALACSSPGARAQISNQATQITFDQPVRVPGQVLAPGTYWFTVVDSGTATDLNQVQIKNADGTKVIAQLETANAAQAQEGQDETVNGVHWPSGKVVLTFAEGTSGQPITLLDWYYPGREEGHRFVYAGRQERQIREQKQVTLTFNPGDKIEVGRSLASFE